MRCRVRSAAVARARRHNPGVAVGAPVEEVEVGTRILESLNLRPRGLEIVSCRSCGHAQVDVYKLANQVTAGLEGLDARCEWP